MTGQVPASVLSSLRGLQAQLMTASAVVSRPPNTDSGGDGTYKPGTPAAVGTYACNVTPMTDEARRLYTEQVSSVATHTIRFPSTATVQSGDLAVISGTTFNILGTNNKRTGMLYLEAAAVEVGS